MNERQQALLGYVRAIATDAGVLASRTPDMLYDAVIACLKADLPAVSRLVLRGLVRVGVQRAAPLITERVVGGLEGVLDGIFNRIEDAVSGKKR